MQRETKQSISVLALVFAIFAFAGYGYATTVNTTLNHSELQNLSYSLSGHTGFESSSHASTTYETISNVGALGTAYRFHEHQSPFGGPLGNGGQVSYTDLKNKPNLSEKLNKTGDNISYLNIMSDQPSISTIFSANNTSSLYGWTIYDNRGVQKWNLTADGVSGTGEIFYAMPGGYPGIIIRPVGSTLSSPVIRYTTTDAGIGLKTSNNWTVGGNQTIMGLAGSGNASACLDSSGKLYRGNPGC